MAEQQNYDGFISYSHAADDLLAPRLQSALQRFAKPWWKRRAVRIFRDESSLAANPHLWSSITEALETSGWFVLLLSPDAAASEWVGREIEHWKATKPADRILPVVTDGEFGWSDGEVNGSSVPEALRGVFSEEPRWVDMRFAKSDEHLDLQNPTFSAAIADIASAIRGVPKDELESEEVREHRRTVRTAWAAGGLVAVLAVVAVGFGVQSSRNADEAERQADIAEANAVAADRNAGLALAREFAASAIAVVDSDPQLAVLLALEAIDDSPSGVDQPVEVVNALWEAMSENRHIATIPNVSGGRTWVALADEGAVVVMVAPEGSSVRGFAADNFELLWEYAEQTVDTFDQPSVSPDGGLIAVPIVDSSAVETTLRGEMPHDDDAARMVVLDATTGSRIVTLRFPGCHSPYLSAFSPDGRDLVVGSGFEGCEREVDGPTSWADVFSTSTWQRTHTLGIEDPAPLVEPAFDPSGQLYIFRFFADPLLYAADTYEPLGSSGLPAMGVLSPDGTSLAAFDVEDVSLRIFDIQSGVQIDYVAQMRDAFPNFPGGLSYSQSGDLLYAATEGPVAIVWDTATGEEKFRVRGGPAFNGALDEPRQRLYTAHEGGISVWDLSPGGVGRVRIGDLGETPFVNGNGFTVGPELGTALVINLGEQVFQSAFFELDTGRLTGGRLDMTGGPVALLDGTFVYAGLDTVWVKFDPTSGQTTELIDCVSDEASDGCFDSEGEKIDYEFYSSLDGSELAAVGSDGVWTFFDPETGSRLEQVTPRGNGTVLAFGLDWILYRDDSDTFVVDRVTGERLWSGSFFTQFIEISPTGRLIALKGIAEFVWVLDVVSWEATELNLGFARLRALAFRDDERVLAIGDNERLHFVDIDKREVTLTLPIPGVSDVHWLEEEEILIGTTQGEWATITLGFERLVEVAKSSLSRSFSDQECLTYRIDPCPSLTEIQSR